MNLYLKKVGFFPTLLFLLCSAAAVSAQMDGEAARDWSVIFRDTLQRSVLQFWIDHALDTKYGGLVGRLNRQGEPIPPGDKSVVRSEEHTSELQSRFDLVCRLLLEKKNT